MHHLHRDWTARMFRLPAALGTLCTAQPTHRLDAGNFVRWARKQKLTRLDFAANRWGGPTGVIDTETRWHQARWLLHDDTVKPEDRVAGLLVLLYAQRAADISRLSIDHVHISDDQVHVRRDKTAAPVLDYDPIGRITTANSPAGNHTYSWTERGLLASAVGYGGTATYTYEGDGNLTGRVDPTSTFAFGYDNSGRRRRSWTRSPRPRQRPPMTSPAASAASARARATRPARSRTTTSAGRRATPPPGPTPRSPRR